MSINPLQPLTEDLVESYDADIHGPRRFIVESNADNINFVRSIYNVKLNPYLIDFNTLRIGKIKHAGMNGDIQRVNVEISYKDKNGKDHKQSFPFERMSLREILLPRLKAVEYWFELPCREYNDYGILLAFEEIGIALTLEDVEFVRQGQAFFSMEALQTSLGWYGDVYLKLV